MNEKARLDPNGTAKGKTTIIPIYPDDGNCQGPGMEEGYLLVSQEEEEHARYLSGLSSDDLTIEYEKAEDDWICRELDKMAQRRR